MAHAAMDSNGAYLTFESGAVRHARFRVEPTHGDNLIEVVFFDENGTELGTPKRFKATENGMIAVDSPGGLNPAFFTVDDEGRNIDG